MSLVLTFAIRTVDQRVVSPLLCGSHPYPYGSLTYRLTLLLYSSLERLSIKRAIFFYFGKTSAIRRQISLIIVFGAAVLRRACPLPSWPKSLPLFRTTLASSRSKWKS